ncbi:MAG TPA: hypothetical protein VKX96_04885 [Chloroflexota bacterium]|jgi:hypothetical protein|nr:hypothetical protein [Chloroflexota bacterium]
MAQRRRDENAPHSYRLKEPVSPSVRGTGKQSRREEKGMPFSTMHHGEGAGHPAGHGRGGKESRH